MTEHVVSYLCENPPSNPDLPIKLVVLVFGGFLIAVLWAARPRPGRRRLPVALLGASLVVACSCTATPRSELGVWHAVGPDPIQVILEADGTGRVIFGTEIFQVRR